MDNGHREQLIHFVLRTGMYIQPVDEHNTISFLTGFEVCAKGNCFFMELCSKLLEGKYRIRYGSRGFPEQIEKLAERRKETWVFAFIKIALEILTKDGAELSSDSKEFLKYVVDRMVESADYKAFESLSQRCLDQWQMLHFLKYPWVKVMWTVHEWKIIRQINHRIRKEKASALP